MYIKIEIMKIKKTIQACCTVVLLLLMNLPVIAQEQGIHFEHGLSWNAIKEKAKKENKYIFVDCYTTWCGPCKMMSAQIFPVKEVGEFFNKNFVNVKAQMDRTEKDNEDVKQWYADADFLAKEYNVLAYPTFLYFNPDGKLVHLYVGSTKEPGDFIKVSGNALDATTQYYTKMESVVKEAGNDPAKLKEMAQEAKKKYDGVNTAKFAGAYIKSQKNLFTKENLVFLDEFINHSTDEGFSLFMKEPGKINAVMGKGFAQRKVTAVAFRECGANEWLMSKTAGGEAEVEQKIRKQFPGMADLLIRKLHITALQYAGNKETFAKEVVSFVKKYGNQIHAQDLSGYARSLGRSEDKQQQKLAMDWAKQAWNNDQSVGTAFVYAALLYKSGEKENAIAMQKKVLELDASKEKGGTNKYYQDILEKMEKGEQL